MAYLRLVAKFHDQGVLGAIFDRKSREHQQARSSRQARASKPVERDAIIDIYNYSAKFDLIPNYHAGREEGYQRKSQYQVTLELPEKGMKAVGLGPEIGWAERNAAIEFKTKAEEHHLNLGDDSLVIKDSSALTAESAPQFLEFWKMARGYGYHTQITAKSDESNVPSQQDGDTWGFQIFIDEQPVGPLTRASNKGKAESLAYLSAAVTLKKQDPGLFPRYLDALVAGHGKILKQLSPLDMRIDEDCSLIMKETLLAARRKGLPDTIDEMDADDLTSYVASSKRFQYFPSPQMLDQLSKSLKHKLKAYREDPDLQRLRDERNDLPMNQYKAKVLDLIQNNTYSIVVGATGSGKTTQVPQIIFEHAIEGNEGGSCNVICTQPRRIAATSVSLRVAYERGESLQDTVGYHVKGENFLPKIGGSLTYCTTGILLQQLQREPDAVMDGISHLIIDEVHERDVLIDFLLILVKRTIKRRQAEGKSVPKVVLMSATIDTDVFANYFTQDGSTGEPEKCPSLSVPGRTFPVKEMYLDEILEDMSADGSWRSAFQAPGDTSAEYLDAERAFSQSASPGQAGSEAGGEAGGDVPAVVEDRSVIDWKKKRKWSPDGESSNNTNEKEDSLVPIGLIASTIAHIAKTTTDGAILVFMPGIEEIDKVEDQLLNNSALNVDFRATEQYKIYKLHSSIPDAQTAVFETLPQGCRKVIISTNIAETSITIPDVQHVVDSGKLRENQYDQVRRITALVCTWISKSNAKQRAGRAGRVQNGNYYALYSKERYDSLRAVGLPEMLRSDLQEVCLDIKAQAFQTPIREFLAEALEPPSPKAVDTSVLNLQALDALTDDEEITSLGRLLASLPVHPSLGKMIVLGIVFRCLDPILILGAGGERSVFTAPPERRIEALQAKIAFVEGSGSDHIALLTAVRELRRMRRAGDRVQHEFAMRNFLHLAAYRHLENTARQIEDILIRSGIIPEVPLGVRRNGEWGGPALNANSRNTALIKALLLAGTHPNLGVSIGGPLFRTPGENDAMLHPGSTNAQEFTGENTKQEFARFKYGKLFTYSTMQLSNDGRSTYLRETTESTPLMAALFGGRLKRDPRAPNIIELDSWLPFYVRGDRKNVAQVVVEFRKALQRLLIRTFQDLGTLAAQHRRGERTSPYLADDEVRNIFATGLVDVLSRDVRSTEETRTKGWGGPTR